jgi:hypothetical protein
MDGRINIKTDLSEIRMAGTGFSMFMAGTDRMMLRTRQ